MTFRSREEAGALLGHHLAARNIQADLVLGLPRGGVVVAAGVAQVLHRPLDILVVRKIGHPFFREFAVGALAEENVVLLDQTAIRRSGVDEAELQAVIAEEQERLGEYQRKFRTTSAPATFQAKTVLIVDDGLATGATTEAAVVSARKRQAAQVLLAIPVSSEDGFQRLSRAADQVIALSVDPGFEAVGQYYRHFPQTTDEEVLRLLALRLER